MFKVAYLIEVVKGFVQVGKHASGRFISDFDGGLENTLWDDMTFAGSRGLSTDIDTVRFMTFKTILLQLLLEGTQPFSH